MDVTQYDELRAFQFKAGKGYDKRSVEEFRALSLNAVDALMREVVHLRDELVASIDAAALTADEHELVARHRSGLRSVGTDDAAGPPVAPAAYVPPSSPSQFPLPAIDEPFSFALPSSWDVPPPAPPSPPAPPAPPFAVAAAPPPLPPADHPGWHPEPHAPAPRDEPPPAPATFGFTWESGTPTEDALPSWATETWADFSTETPAIDLAPTPGPEVEERLADATPIVPAADAADEATSSPTPSKPHDGGDSVPVTYSWTLPVGRSWDGVPAEPAPPSAWSDDTSSTLEAPTPPPVLVPSGNAHLDELFNQLDFGPPSPALLRTAAAPLPAPRDRSAGAVATMPLMVEEPVANPGALPEPTPPWSGWIRA